MWVRTCGDLGRDREEGRVRTQAAESGSKAEHFHPEGLPSPLSSQPPYTREGCGQTTSGSSDVRKSFRYLVESHVLAIMAHSTNDPQRVTRGHSQICLNAVKRSSLLSSLANL